MNSQNFSLSVVKYWWIFDGQEQTEYSLLCDAFVVVVSLVRHCSTIGALLIIEKICSARRSCSCLATMNAIMRTTIITTSLRKRPYLIFVFFYSDLAKKKTVWIWNRILQMYKCWICRFAWFCNDSGIQF